MYRFYFFLCVDRFSFHLFTHRLRRWQAPTPLFTLTPAQARTTPTAADAVLKVMQDHNISMPEPKADTWAKTFP